MAAIGEGNSAIYVGSVRHKRPAPASHEFTYRLFMLYLDLDEVSGLFGRNLLFSSSKRPAPFQFRRTDYLNPKELDLKKAVRLKVLEGGGPQTTGPIRMLTHLRMFGLCFNPVTFYYCFSPDGNTLQAILAEINNTPWDQRYTYVLLPESAGRTHRFSMAKNFHVSPFMPMDVDYRWTFNTPGESLVAHMENHHQSGGGKMFHATLALRRQALSMKQMINTNLKHPLITHKVLLGIYLQAFNLWRKGVPFHVHP